MSVEVIAGQLESVVEVHLERGIGGLALALDGAVVKADVLAAHEHAVGLPVTIHVDTAVGILLDLWRNRRAVPRTEEAVVGGCAVTVLAMEDDAILVEALGRVCTRISTRPPCRTGWYRKNHRAPTDPSDHRH